MHLIKAQDLTWAKSIGSINTDKLNDMAVDANGNVFITGKHLDTLDMDPSAAEHNLTTFPNFDEAFLAKYDAEGNLQWAHQFGTEFGYELGMSVAVDDEGNVYFTGQLGEFGFDFDPGPGVVEVTPVGLSDIFFARFDTDGNLDWVRNFGGDGQFVNCISVDHNNNLYLTGFFQNVTDFDPSTDEYNLSVPNASDVFFAIYNTSGDFITARNFEGLGSGGDYGNYITADDDGNIYVTGFFYQTVDFDPGPGVSTLTSNGLQDVFLAKYNPGASFAWAISLGGLTHEGGNWLTVDDDGNIFLIGWFTSTTDFDPAAGSLTIEPEGLTDIFVSEYNGNGEMLWTKTIGSTGNDIPFSIMQDDDDNLVITGSYSGTVDFDPSAGSAERTSAGLRDMFLASYTASGNYLWSKSMGGFDEDFSHALGMDADGNLYIAGEFKETADLDPSENVVSLISNGDVDILMAKYGDSGINVVEKEVDAHISVYPNPFVDQLKIDLGEYYSGLSVEVSDAVGKIVLRKQLVASQKLVLDLPVANGVYMLTVRSGEKVVGTARIIN